MESAFLDDCGLVGQDNVLLDKTNMVAGRNTWRLWGVDLASNFSISISAPVVGNQDAWGSHFATCRTWRICCWHLTGSGFWWCILPHLLRLFLGTKEGHCWLSGYVKTVLCIISPKSSLENKVNLLLYYFNTTGWEDHFNLSLKPHSRGNLSNNPVWLKHQPRLLLVHLMVWCRFAGIWSSELSWSKPDCSSTSVLITHVLGSWCFCAMEEWRATDSAMGKSLSCLLYFRIRKAYFAVLFFFFFCDLLLMSYIFIPIDRIDPVQATQLEKAQ